MVIQSLEGLNSKAQYSSQEQESGFFGGWGEEMWLQIHIGIAFNKNIKYKNILLAS